MKGRRTAVSLVIVGATAALALVAGSGLALAADFDGDGYADLAIGVEWEDVGTITNAGAVNILYGTSSGITAGGDQIWDQDDLSASDGSEEYDNFGKVLAAGDFDGDGAIDLAVGIEYEDVGALENGGRVHIIYGVVGPGLAASGNQSWDQDSPYIEGAVEEGDRFGRALAVGDFDGDGYSDLAIGVPFEAIGTTTNAGAVNVIYGTSAGLSAAGDQMWYEGFNGLGGAPEENDIFGEALAAGDFDGDGYDDLAIGIPGDDLGGVDDAGRIVILYGTGTGLSATGTQAWVQGLNGVGNGYEEGDQFGKRMTTGDFNGDGYADLAVGTPYEDNGATSNTGVVNVLYGSAGGLQADDDEVWFGLGYETDDYYGWALAAGDFNGDGRDDLAVGIPYDDLVSLTNSGAVEILYGASTGLIRRVANDYWHQDRSGVFDVAEEGDLFAYALAAGDFDTDGYVDLAIGVRNEDVGSIVDAGAVAILYGSSDGIAATGNQFWHQDSQYVEGMAEAEDHFGNALAAIPRTQSDDLFADGFESGNTSHWSGTAP